jgi:Fe-S-cluster containining protein
VDISTEVDTIADNARNSISDYCINNCKAKCCKRGKLVLFNEKEVNAIVGEHKQKYIEQNILTVNPKTSNYHYDLEKKSCKNLTTKNLCSIHNLNSKPRICRDYPLFILGKYVIVAQDCQAAQNNLLDKHVLEIVKLGYKKI